MIDPDEPGAGASGADATPPTKRRLVVLGGIVLVALGVLLGWWAIAGGSQTSPSAAPPAPTATVAGPTATPTANPSASVPAPGSADAAPSEVPETEGAPPAAPSEPGAAAPVIERFAPGSDTASCADDRDAVTQLDFSWSVTGADEVWIGVGTTDASVLPTASVPATADSYGDLTFACRDEEQLVTLTARGPGGSTSSSVAVTRRLE